MVNVEDCTAQRMKWKDGIEIDRRDMLNQTVLWGLESVAPQGLNVRPRSLPHGR